MYSTYNNGKSVVTERFIRTLKKNNKHTIAYVNTIRLFLRVGWYVVNKYNKTVHRTIKMKPIDVTDDSYAGYNESFNKKRS